MTGLSGARVARKSWLRSGVAAAACLLSLPAFGQNINTGQGQGAAQYWGPYYNGAPLSPLATYGQTITPTAGQTVLTSFTFFVVQTTGTASPMATALVYQWDPFAKTAVGNPLFTQQLLPMPGNADDFLPVLVITGKLKLTPGQHYVLLLTTAAYGGVQSTYFWQMGLGSYDGGQFVAQDTRDELDWLTSESWLTPQGLADLSLWAMFLSKLSLSSGAPANHANVVAALNDYVDRGGTIPTELLMLSEAELLEKLKQLSGEAATGAQQSGIQLMNNFMSLLLDPFADSRKQAGIGGASGYAPESKSKISAAAAEAYAKVLKEPAAPASLDQRWSVWGSTYGGYSKFDGDRATQGSHGTTTRGYGFAVGADYRASPDTMFGFALAGGGVSWSLAEGLGSGTGDAFQAGIYATHWMNNVYVSAALAGSWFDMSTERSVNVIGTDILSADFNATSFGGRLESGIRTGLFGIDTTPYAAVQVQRFRTDGYSEDVKSGSKQFALSYGDTSQTATRTELGFRFANEYWKADGCNYSVFGKLAWAHDFDTDRALTPVFQSMGSSFIVNGAEADSDLALVQVGVEARLANGWSAMAKLGGEFGGDTQTYTAQGRLRYAW
jgi:outer membrane autotransporter protein